MQARISEVEKELAESQADVERLRFEEKNGSSAE